MSKKVLIAIADDVEDVETVAMIDCLRRAGAEVTIASVQNLQIRTARDIKITADCLIGDCVSKNYELIALPGGLPGAEYLANCAELIEMLKKQKSSGKYYAAICASPAVVFERHRLLAGKKATCYPSMSTKIKDGTYLDQRVVVDGNCVTSQGPGTALEFSLKLIELLFGIEKSKGLEKAMLVK